MLSNSKLSIGAVPRAVLVVALSAPLVLLTACGGGGGGGGEVGGGDPSAVVQLSITEANSQPVAAEALQTAEQGSTVANLGASMATGVQVEGAGAVSGPLVLAGIARKMFTMRAPSPVLATGVTVGGSESCSGGGSVSATETRALENAVGVGDRAQIVFSNCVESVNGVTLRVNGSATGTVTAGGFGEFSSFPLDITMHMVLDQLSIAAGSESASIDGSLDLRLQQSSASAGTVTLATPSLKWASTTASGSHAITLKDYSHSVAVTSAGSTIQMAAIVETSNSRFGTGVVSYAISMPQAATADAAGTITAGSLKVSGNGSALLLTVTAPDTFSLQVDANGDGSYESSKAITRGELQALR